MLPLRLHLSPRLAALLALTCTATKEKQQQDSYPGRPITINTLGESDRQEVGEGGGGAPGGGGVELTVQPDQPVIAVTLALIDKLCLDEDERRRRLHASSLKLRRFLPAAVEERGGDGENDASNADSSDLAQLQLPLPAGCAIGGALGLDGEAISGAFSQVDLCVEAEEEMRERFERVKERLGKSAAAEADLWSRRRRASLVRAVALDGATALDLSYDLFSAQDVTTVSFAVGMCANPSLERLWLRFNDDGNTPGFETGVAALAAVLDHPHVTIRGVDVLNLPGRITDGVQRAMQALDEALARQQTGPRKSPLSGDALREARIGAESYANSFEAPPPRAQGTLSLSEHPFAGVSGHDFAQSLDDGASSSLSGGGNKAAVEVPPVFRRSDRLSGLRCVVTGGAGAIGTSCCRALAANGAIVSLCDLDGAAARDVAAQIRAEYGADRVGSAAGVDVASPNGAEFAAWIKRDVGPVDVLVNNAAAFVFGEIEEVDDDDWDRVLGVNVKGYANCIKTVIPGMKELRSGSIINMASMSSFIAQPAFVPYNTSKGAILQLTRCVALDAGPSGVRVNAVCPGNIDTPATEKHASKLGKTKATLADEMVKEHFIKRLGTTADVANAVVFLASGESAFITGTTLAVDGGFMAH